MSIDNCHKCGEPVDTDKHDDCYIRFTCYCPSCREKHPKTEFLARITMAVAQVTIHNKDGELYAQNAYWSRHTGGTNETLIERAKPKKDRWQPDNHAAFGPYPDRATAREASRERAIAWFTGVKEQAVGVAKDECVEMLTRLKAA